jgi:hypothetical protein
MSLFKNTFPLESNIFTLIVGSSNSCCSDISEFGIRISIPHESGAEILTDFGYVSDLFILDKSSVIANLISSF